MQSQELKEEVRKLPDTPGVYYFLSKVTNNKQPTTNKVLYVGKATSIRSRVKSYFAKDIMSRRGPLIAKMVEEIEGIKYLETESVLEALILEANEIKRHQPYFNSREKDDKSHNFVVVTKEDYPRVLLVRGRNLLKTARPSLSGGRGNGKLEIAKQFGPFPHGAELREALKIIRKIFPYRDKCTPRSEAKNPDKVRPCFNAQIGLCSGVCTGSVDKREYRKMVRHLVLFFEGKKDKLILELERDMKKLAKEEKFEEAERVKRQIYALQHIQDIAMIKSEIIGTKSQTGYRIEAYDIAHISGTNAVGVMTVVVDGELDKSQYRKFKIKLDKNDDVGSLKEVLTRRLNHPEWRLPDLIVVDGGVAQLNAAKGVLDEHELKIDVVGVVKDSRHKAREILGRSVKSSAFDKDILLANAEAHRFAINYHRLLRSRGFRI